MSEVRQSTPLLEQINQACNGSLEKIRSDYPHTELSDFNPSLLTLNALRYIRNIIPDEYTSLMLTSIVSDDPSHYKRSYPDSIGLLLSPQNGENFLILTQRQQILCQSPAHPNYDAFVVKSSQDIDSLLEEAMRHTGRSFPDAQSITNLKEEFSRLNVSKKGPLFKYGDVKGILEIQLTESDWNLNIIPEGDTIRKTFAHQQYSS